MMENNTEKKFTFYPVQLFLEAIVALIALGIVITLAVLLPVEYEEQANTLITPFSIKPEWYFLWLFQLLKYIPTTAGLVVVLLVVLGLLGLPFIDREPSRLPKDRKWVITLGALLLIIISILTILGAVG
ncbi:MAG: cytochrome b subunit of the bc complex [Deltaproteobacteria bacterium]|nr:MAG: cytochrome b subunit of the bc complex [Deltaproteobacteria bacterium]